MAVPTRRRRLPLQGLRARRRAAGYYPRPQRLRRLIEWVARHLHTMQMAVCVVLSVAAVVHLVAALLLPGGRNELFGWRAPAGLAYLTLAPVDDTMGFYVTRHEDAFIVYRIYTQGGQVVSGTIPDPELRPRLRYDRWARAGHLASGPTPQVHRELLDYLLQRLPNVPLKMELYAARWRGVGRDGAAPAAEADDERLALRALGTYDGLKKTWSPAAP